jgi:protein disulfide-isomerase
MKLKSPFFILTLIMPLLQIHGAETMSRSIEWQTNYEKAVTESKEKGVPLLMFFTGSDWCSWCNKLESEVLDTPQFKDAVGSKFVFLKVDKPAYRTLDAQTKAQNEQLQKKYDITGWPTIILFDTQKLQVIGKTGYQRGGAQNYASHLLKMVSDYNAYKQKTSQIDSQKHSGAELKKLYAKAKELDIYTDINRILKAGLASEEKLFFQLERYRFLVEEGSLRDPEAQLLRKELLAADPTNARKLPYQVAIIDFELLSLEAGKEGYSPDITVAPLVSYIEQFGMQDPENLWRLEMIISQVYLDHDKMSQALKYAQSSHEAAPATIQPEIAKAIRNIQVVAQIH